MTTADTHPSTTTPPTTPPGAPVPRAPRAGTPAPRAPRAGTAPDLTARAARLHAVVRQVVDTLDDVVHVSVDLGDGSPVGATATTAVTATSASVLDQHQRVLGDGPTVRATRTRTPVCAGTDELRASWPSLAAAAAAAGVRSVVAVPVPLPGPPGAVTVYRSTEGRLDAGTRTVVELLADAVALVATEGAAVASAARMRTQFAEAVRWRAPIEQAKGILMALHQVDSDTAFAMLRSESQSTNTRLRDLVSRFVAKTCGSAAAAGCEAAGAAPAPTPASSHDFRAAFAVSPVATAITDLQGCVLEANDALGRLLGRAPAELRGTPLVAHTHPGDRAGASAALDALRVGAATECVVDTRVRRDDGTTTPVTLACAAQLDPLGGPVHVTVHLTDRSAEVQAAQRLRQAAAHDPLTALPNRCLLEEHADAAERHRRAGDPVSVLYLDIDRFKAVNDTHGHAVGDAVLVALARRLEAAVRPGDTVARVGGDELVVLCPGTGQADARALADRLGTLLAAPVPCGGTRLSVDVSIGTATSSGDETVAELLHAADTAMYAAKRAPGARS